MPIGSQFYHSRDITTAFVVLDLNFKADSVPISPSHKFPLCDWSPKACTLTLP